MANLNDYLKKIEAKLEWAEEQRRIEEYRRQQDQVERLTERAQNDCREHFDNVVMGLIDWTPIVDRDRIYFSIDIFGHKSLLYVMITERGITLLIDGDNPNVYWGLNDIDRLILRTVEKVRNE